MSDFIDALRHDPHSGPAAQPGTALDPTVAAVLDLFGFVRASRELTQADMALAE